ncbi:polysaccharide deacetylase family protein [Lysinibacillus macroides]|uniref:1,4-beta-xylanase n=1 Tax=Lysinibacillus macroides TaxID=33935 RepID=A0A0N0UXJ9_9BACI|nr:polysaccharide deacetylase family protein [Lysinibacillus macroides]KOY84085.1 1,4-beta-xylanase [Lysinibacillus macroides]QPR66854.1 polysaccharide deacetylase family protein [Lysinibacillus macroides]
MQERRRRRGPIIDFLLLGLIVTLTTIILVIILSKDEFKFQKISASKETDTESVNSNLSTESSAFPGIRIVTDVSNDQRTPFAIHYPQTDNEAFNDAVLQYISDSKENYLASMKKNKDKEAMGELNISFETFPYREHYYSFVLTKMLYLGGANHEVSIKTFFINNETGEQISIQILLQNDENNLSTLAASVRKDLQKNLQIKDALLNEELLKATEPKWSNFERFAIVDDSLQFYFDEYEIASGAAGAPVVKLSLSLINPLLASDFQIAMENVQPTNPTPTGDPTKKRIALTFDDGPHPKVTEQILNILDKYHAKATFFMLGSRVQYYPDIANDVLARGHEVGNHTWNHPVLTKLTHEQVMKEFNATAAEIEKAINQGATVFRPPYGATNDAINAEIPIPVVLWTIDTLDWKHRNAQQLLPHIKNNLHNNAIVLMHDIHQSTADGLDAVLAYLQEQGYEFVTVSEILPYRQ